MEKLLALEMVRVTEAAAVASARFMGRGDRDEADHAATEAMRPTMDEIELAGTIVIGEGERDEAPMLYIGEQVGLARRGRDGAPGRHRRRPAGGHQPRRHGRRRARSPSWPRPRRGGLIHAPDTYLEKLASGPSRPATSTSRQPPAENIRPDRRGPAPQAVGHHRHHPRPAAARAAHRRGPRDRRPDQAHLRRRRLGRDLVRRPGHGRPCRDGHRRRARRRASRRRRCAAWAARSRLASGSATTRTGSGPRRCWATRDEDRVYRTEDLAAGDELVFAATGRHRRRAAPGRPLLRRRRPDPLAGDGLPDQAGPVRGHGPHVRPRAAAGRPPVGRWQADHRASSPSAAGGSATAPTRSSTSWCST